MSVQRYEVNQYSVDTLMNWIKSKAIGIPEIQRPFVWTPVKVRDFIDSLYRGYPVGYLIAWNSADIRLKGGGQSSVGKRLIIDGQQRMTALLAALLGEPVVDKSYQKIRIRIAFHPGEEKFEVANPAIDKNREWISDIAEVFAPDASSRRLTNTYFKGKPDADESVIEEIGQRIDKLISIRNNHLGIIDLHGTLSLEEVSEVFLRINSQGVQLTAADFVMSKMAASEKYDGHKLHKCIDYFCHLAVAPEAYEHLAKDAEFADTEYFHAMEWLRHEKEDLYDPTRTDMLRVVCALGFRRGKLNDLAELLSGRNFETRTNEESIAEKSFLQLKASILSYVNNTNFKRFLMILRSAGFVNTSMIRSQATINFAYILYLTLRDKKEQPAKIEKLVRRWFVMSLLLGRYSGSAESAFDRDIGLIEERGAASLLEEIERASLSDIFWEVGLPGVMWTSNSRSGYLSVFMACQIKANDKGFLSSDYTVQNLLEGSWDMHHVVPRSYLQKHGLQPSRYNQIANFVPMQREINIRVGNQPPATYFKELREQCQGGPVCYGGITNAEQMRANFAAHCIPEGMERVTTVDAYDQFLEDRRKLMAGRIRDYYEAL